MKSETRVMAPPASVNIEIRSVRQTDVLARHKQRGQIALTGGQEMALTFAAVVVVIALFLGILWLVTPTPIAAASAVGAAASRNALRGLSPCNALDLDRIASFCSRLPSVAAAVGDALAHGAQLRA